MRRFVMLAAAIAVLTTRPAPAQQPSYDRHFLDSAEYFIASDSMSGAYQSVAVGRLLTAASSATRGEGQFLVVGGGGSFTTGQRVWTRWFWRTRPAAAAEAGLGAVVFCLNNVRDGVYAPPASRSEAMNTGWWMATVTDVSDLYRQEVRAGEYRLSLDCLRISATAVPAAAAPAPGPAQFDAHYLDSAEYFIAEHAPQGDEYVAVGRMLIGPTETSRGAAQFLVVGAGGAYSLGQRVWTQYYWRTRPATPAEATVGRQVFCLNVAENSVYRGPRERNEALNSGWWLSTITDTSDLYRQEVRAGEYRLGLGCLRVTR